MTGRLVYGLLMFADCDVFFLCEYSLLSSLVSKIVSKERLTQ